MKGFIFGTSSQGLSILAYKYGTTGPKILILGGVHGNEPEGATAAWGLLRRFDMGFGYHVQVTIVPVFNPDGLLKGNRLNGRGVDLNRNLPTTDWNPQAFNEKYPPGPAANSEPETQCLVKYLAQENPRWILSLHSWKPLLNVNGRCRPEAECIAKQTGYAIEESVGYPTPGCLGTYCGLERDMPTLTYEIERGLSTENILKIHVPAVCEALKVAEIDRR